MSRIRELSDEDRIHLGRVVLQILSDWGVEPEHQVTLLGLPENTRPRSLQGYRGTTPLPQDEDILMRAHQILTIQNAVESMYPHNASVAHYWITTPNQLFSDKTPLEIMLIHGLEGMDRVIQQLNGTSDWY